MINRILIRIKVVQILYSYLLSRSEFKIDSAPEAPSRDRKFAYAVYLDMLSLIQELSGIRTNNPTRALPAIEVHPKFRTNRVGRALADNPQLKSTTYREIADLNAFAPVLQNIADTTGGRYFRATGNNVLAEIFDEIDKLEKTEMDVRHFSHTEDNYILWAWLAFGFFALELVLRYTVLRSIP